MELETLNDLYSVPTQALRLVAIMCAALLVACTSYVELRAQSQPTGGFNVVDVAQVANNIALEEIARIGVVTGPPEYIFGEIVDLHVDVLSKEILVLDGQSHSVTVFDLKGEYLRSWGRAGEGPGDIEGPVAIAAARDTVLVADAEFIHMFARDGGHLGSFRPRTVLPITYPADIIALDAGWALKMLEVEPGVTGSVPFQRIYRLLPNVGVDSSSVLKVPRNAPTPDERLGPRWWVTPLLSHRPEGTVNATGQFLWTPDAGYEVHVRSHTGDTRTVLRVQHASPAIDQQTVDAYRNAMREQCSRVDSECPGDWEEVVSIKTSLPTTARRPVLGEIFASREMLLVQRLDLDPDPFRDGEENTYDLISLRGRHVGRVRFPPTFSVMWFGDGIVAGVERDEFDVPYVVVYRHDRGAGLGR